jgi:hypothetical protein
MNQWKRSPLLWKQQINIYTIVYILIEITLLHSDVFTMCMGLSCHFLKFCEYVVAVQSLYFNVTKHL